MSSIKEAQLRVIAEQEKYQQKLQQQKQQQLLKQQQQLQQQPLQRPPSLANRVVAKPGSKNQPAVIPTGRLIKDILEFLVKDPHKQWTIPQISDATKIDLNAHPTLIQELKLNPKIKYQHLEGGDLFQYKALHILKNKNDVLGLISNATEGIDEETLQDTYPGVMKDINELVDAHKVIRIQNSDTKHNILFYNDDRFTVQVYPEFQALWSSVKIPDDVDLEKFMTNAGLSMMAQEKKTHKRPAQKERKSTARKLTKITNIHLANSTDIDLSKDYIPANKIDQYATNKNT